MCGIFFFADKQNGLSQVMLNMINRIKHRGPDETQIRHFQAQAFSVCMAFHRLAVHDQTHNAMQPFEHNGVFALVNGEIWNSTELRQQQSAYQFQSSSDCEVVLPMFLSGIGIPEICRQLNGEYAFLVYDSRKQKLFIACDELSVRPLFIYTGPDSIGVASEAKALVKDFNTVPTARSQMLRLPGGSWCELDLAKQNVPRFNSYMNWNLSYTDFPPAPNASETLRVLLEQSVREKLLTNMNREYAFLLSGGLDSSIVCAMAQKILRETDPLARIRTFTIGIVPDPDAIKRVPEDITAARKVADHLNTDHHELYFSMQEAFNIIPSVVWTTETWDQTTIRAATPMYLGVREIKRRYPQIAVIFSGEVADELLQGYLYNHMCPSPDQGRKDAIRLLQNIHVFDGLRADRCIAGFGCELRLPFFSKKLLHWMLNTDPVYFDPKSNHCIEKYVLRKACEHLLPEQILWRTKQALSDASSHESGWKDFIKSQVFNEDVYYKKLFDSVYMGYSDLIPYKWMPAGWIQADDSSAATLKLDIDFKK